MSVSCEEMSGVVPPMKVLEKSPSWDLHSDRHANSWRHSDCKEGFPQLDWTRKEYAIITLDNILRHSATVIIENGRRMWRVASSGALLHEWQVKAWTEE